MEIKKLKRYYIFRCGLLVGKQMRKNSLYRLVRAKSKTKLSLSPKSTLYLTAYQDVLAGIKKIIKQKEIKNGIYNLVSKEKFYFKNLNNENIHFGKYNLSYSKIDNSKYEKNFQIKTKHVNKLIKEIEKF